MSEWDEMEFDDEELSALHEDANPDSLTPEEIFKVALINKAKGVMVRVELKDEDGDTVSLSDTIAQLIEYIKDRLKEDSNQFIEQIMPLMAQSVVSGLGRMMGTSPTAFLLSNDISRHAIVDMMCTAFLLLKFVQDHGLKIHTYEQEISEEEMEEIERKSKATKVTTMGAMAGMDPKEILDELVQRGDITPEDLEDLIGKKGKDPNGKN